MQCCVFTRGEILIADFDSSCELSGLNCSTSKATPFVAVGNVSQATIAIDSSLIGTENKYLKISDPCSRVPIVGANLTLTINCAKTDNLLKALYSEKKEDESGTKEDAYCVNGLQSGYFFPFSKKQATLSSVEVTLVDVDNEVVNTLILDTDYKLSKSGIEILQSISTVGSDRLIVSYDYDTEGYSELDFGIKKQGYKSIYFRGTNYASPDKTLYDVKINKVLFKPVSEFQIITGSEMLSIVLEGVIEKCNNTYFQVFKQEE